MKPENAAIGMAVEVYARGTITFVDNWPSSSEPKINVGVVDGSGVERKVWFDSSDVEPAERAIPPPIKTWRDVAADAILEGRDAEALHLIGQKAPGVLPYIHALQQLYTMVSGRAIPPLSREEQFLIVEISRLINVPAPKTKNRK